MDDSVSRLWGEGKLILGPMVRASSLPLRLAALEYGADVVYSEEIPAHRAGHANCIRYFNPVLDTVDFIEQKASLSSALVLFRTHVEQEIKQGRCVLQLGCSDSVTALKAAQKFEKDVAAIDINMGCAKHYSVSRGMGSALMTRPEIAEDIIKTLRRNLSIPVSVKTRLHSSGSESIGCGEVSRDGCVDIQKSESWLQQLQACGAQAIALHMRSPCEKYRDAAHIELFAQFHRKMSCSNTPLVYNGDIWSRADLQRLQNSVRCSDQDGNVLTKTPMRSVSVMLCRAGLWNPSIFSELIEEGTQHIPRSDEVRLKELLSCIVKQSAKTANCPLNTRYLLQQILAGAKKLNSNLRSSITRSYDLVGISTALDCNEYVRTVKQQQTDHWCRLTSQASSNKEYDSFVDCFGDRIKQNDDEPKVKTSVTSSTIPRSSFNSNEWPGIVSMTSHEYNDRYFDDNYYVAFNRPSSGTCSWKELAGSAATSSVKRPFSYSGFTESSSTVVRVKRTSSVN